MSIYVIDNFYDTENLNNVIQKSDNYNWYFGRTDANDETYWTVQVYGELHNSNINYDNFHLKEVEQIWDEFSNKFKIPTEKLLSCYLNGITYGLEAYPHIDFLHKDCYTTVITYVTDEWNSYWGGETCFFNGNFVQDPSNSIFYQHDIIKSVLPKYNRVVIFDSSITHAVRTLSKSFKGLRKTLMFKLKDMPVEQLMENYKCN